MPLISSSMQGLSQVKALSQLMSGSKLPSIISAVTSASCQYILASSIVNSTNIAVGPGSGTQIGRISGLVPQAMTAMMLLKGASYGISGKDFRKLCDAVSFGVCNSMKTVIVQGVIIGAGPGSGTGKITGLVPSALENLIYAQSLFRLISGSRIRQIMSSIAFGICNHILSAGTVTLTDIGVAAGPPVGPITIPAAPGIARLV